MRIYRSCLVSLQQAEQFLDGQWVDGNPEYLKNAMVLSDVSEEEHDEILNIKDHLDTMMSGYLVDLIVHNSNGDDPKKVNLPMMPCTGQVIRHQDKYYVIDGVLQSTGPGIAVFVRSIAFDNSYFSNNSQVLKNAPSSCI